MRALTTVRKAPTLVAMRMQLLKSADRESGMATAEYAVATVAACGFSGILYKLLTSPEVLGLLRDVISRAFKLAF